ncbi:MAG: dihydrolipoyl dehydrogenase [bacterium]|nr:dihydrolipoyl dehydrogenase [bacterium]
MSYDILIIGGGPGGYVAAIRAAQLGAKVCVVEKDKVGGTCLNRGCIPTKSILSSIKVLSLITEAEHFGIEVGNFKPNFKAIIDRKNTIIEKSVQGIEFLFKSYGVDLVRGEGSIKKAGLVVVKDASGEKEIEAKNIIVASGSEPANIPMFQIDGKKVITSTEALNLTEYPEKIIIIGGGVIGCEFATIFSRLGVKVTIIEMMPCIIPTEDIQLGRRLQSLLKKQGIEIFTGSKITKLTKDKDVTVELESGEKYTADLVLVSIGRSLNTKNLGLENIGVKTGPRGEIIVNEFLETNVPGIYAIGDVTAKIMLAHVASAQGRQAVENILKEKKPMDYSLIPSCIFTQPEIGTIGLSETKAKEKGIDVTTGTFQFAGLGKAQAMGETEGIARLIVDKKTDKILGGQIIGPDATSLIAEVVLAIKLGATAMEIAETIHAHPTLPEAVLEAAEDVHDMSVHLAKKKKR